MKITHLDSDPLFTIPSINVAPGGRRIEQRHIPFLHGRVTGLPEPLQGLLITSDLQGFEPAALEKPEAERTLLGHLIVNTLEPLLGHGNLPPGDQIATLLCGDFYAIPALNKRGGLGDVEAIWRAFGRLTQTVIGVAGNHDRFGGTLDIDTFFDPAENITGLNVGTADLHGLTIGGISGVLSVSEKRPWRHTPTTFLHKATQLLTHRPDILLLHEAPSRTFGHNRGSFIIRKVLQRVQHEMLVFCGHRHWADPLLTLSDQVQILNCDSRVVLLTAA